MTNLTNNFGRHEFACKCRCGFDEIDERLVHRLQVISDIIGLPMIINSGCRCEQHNKNIGGSDMSYHLTGKAADWCFNIPRDEKFYSQIAVLIGNWSGGFHYYEDKKFFHCDLGPKRRW
jgi:uncharacterized protein YcbK (DUF882 family)